MSCGPFCLAVAALDFFGLPRALGGTNPPRGHFTARCNCEATELVTDPLKPLFMRGCLMSTTASWATGLRANSVRDETPSQCISCTAMRTVMHSLLKSNHYNRGVTNKVYITILKVILSKTLRFHSHCLYTCQRLLNVSETSHLLPSTIFIFTSSDVVTTMWDNVKPCCWGCKFYVIFSLSIF